MAVTLRVLARSENCSSSYGRLFGPWLVGKMPLPTFSLALRVVQDARPDASKRHDTWRLWLVFKKCEGLGNGFGEIADGWL